MIKTIIILSLLMGGVGCSSKRVSDGDDQQKVSDSPLLVSMQSVAGYGVSLPAAGVGYLADGMIYTVGSVGIFGVMCFPIFLLSNSNRINQLNNPCLPYTGVAFDALERNHPKFGRKIWEGMGSLRDSQ